jgi:hypothetical protein
MQTKSTTFELKTSFDSFVSRLDILKYVKLNIKKKYSSQAQWLKLIILAIYETEIVKITG